MFENLKNYKFKMVGDRFNDEEERIKFVARRLHHLSWKNKPNREEQDGYVFERDENGYPDWNGRYHKEYYALAKHILNLGEFENIATVIEIIDSLV